MLLKGKVAIITGAGRGIGREHALLFAKEGAHVVVNDLGSSRDGSGTNVASANQVVEEITSAGGSAIASCDSVATREGVDNMIWTALNGFERIDILINNAGILRDRSVLKMSEAEWDDVLAVHLRGTFLATQATARVMKRQGTGGRIVNTTSVSGLVGKFGQSNYAAAKMGIAGFTFTCAKEFGRFGVFVNALAPVALTRMTEGLAVMDGHSAESFGPQFIAPAALFLASDLAGDLNGRVLGVEGPRMFEYRVQTSNGVSLDGSQVWTPELLQKRWAEIALPER